MSVTLVEIVEPAPSEWQFERSVNLSKITCNWCYGVAAPWVITDMFGWSDYACTSHGTEWFPSVFPESDPASIEEIVALIPVQH